MSISSFSFFIHIFLTLLLFLSINSGGIKGTVNAKCSNLGSCSYPDSRAHRASFAMNHYFQTNGRQPENCDFKHTALIASSDPSYSKKCSYPGGEAQIPAKKTWCAAKPATTDESVLKDIVKKICSKLDCGIIKPHGPCYIANSLWNQASVAMNLFYLKSPGHKCDFQNAGLLVVVDPSFGSCNMPGKH